MPPEIEHFLKTVANTLLKLEVLLFYTRNPSAIDTVAGLSSRLYRSADQVSLTVQYLSEKRVLTEHELGGGLYHLYAFTEDPTYRRLSEELYSLYHDDPVARVEIIKRIMAWQQGREIPTSQAMCNAA